MRNVADKIWFDCIRNDSCFAEAKDFIPLLTATWAKQDRIESESEIPQTFCFVALVTVTVPASESPVILNDSARA